MIEYYHQKLNSELNELEHYYEILYKDWESPEDYEDLYKIRIPLLMVAILVRTVGHKKKCVTTLRDIKINENPRNLLFTKDEIEGLISSDSFKNKTKHESSLKDVCDYLIHDRSSGFQDSRTSFEQKTGFDIYYSVETDRKEEIFVDIKSFINTVRELVEAKS